MAEQQPIRFGDGDAFEQSMGVWSRLAGEVFLDWLAPEPGLRWLDVGSGGGAFAELIMRRCAPAELHGIDPSEGQLAYAGARPGTRGAEFRQGDAVALPHPDDRFDAAVMALVIFFVPEPARGVAEMARVVRPGGLVAAYAWDILGGGFPFEPVPTALRAAGLSVALPPSVEAARTEALRALWTGAGLREVETRAITVRRSFADFEAFWAATTRAERLAATLAGMAPGEVEALKAWVCARLPAEADGRIDHEARANAIKGRVPG